MWSGAFVGVVFSPDAHKVRARSVSGLFSFIFFPFARCVEIVSCDSFHIFTAIRVLGLCEERGLAHGSACVRDSGDNVRF